MKNYIKIFCVIALAVLVLALSACSESADISKGQMDVVYDEVYNGLDIIADDIITNPTTTAQSEQQGNETDNSFSSSNFPVGGPGARECHLHSSFFCDLGFPSFFVIHDIISAVDFAMWAVPLQEMRASPYDECLVNIVTMIEHFGITREVFQEVVDYHRLDLHWHFNLDIIYSGNWDLINQYYSIENQAIQVQSMYDREQEYFLGRIYALQSRVMANNDTMSDYFHDIVTYAGFSRIASWFYAMWARNIGETGDYERFNIVDFVDRFFDGNREGFERWVLERNIPLFTHYNLDIIFSGDQDLITQYYSIQNQSTHTAIVQAAFNNHIETYGWDTTIVPPTITTANLQSGTVGQPYSQTLETNDNQPVMWTITSGSLPSGIYLSSTGVISGTPVEAGRFNFTIQANNLGGNTTRDLFIEVVSVVSNNPPQIQTITPIPHAYFNHPYTLTLQATGNTPITWSIVTPSANSLPTNHLPEGLYLNAATGTISGTPIVSSWMIPANTRPGTIPVITNFTFTFEARADNDFGYSTRTLSITVLAQSPAVIPDPYPPISDDPMR